MKLNTIKMLLERTLDYHADEYLQVVKIARDLSNRKTSSDVEQAFAMMVGSFDRIQKELYEFWFSRLGNKSDVFEKEGLYVSTDYHGIKIPKDFLNISMHIDMLDLILVAKLFPPKIAKLISRGKEFFDILFNESKVIVADDQGKIRFDVLLATTMDVDEYMDILKTVDTWIALMSRIEFYSDKTTNKDLYLGDVSIKNDYRASELTQYVNDQRHELILSATSDDNLGHEDLHDLVDDLDKTMALMEHIISNSMSLVKFTRLKKRFSRLEYEIDPDTKVVKKHKNSQGKMIPNTRIVYEDEDDDAVMTIGTSVSGRTTKISKRFPFSMYHSAPDFKDLEDTLRDMKRNFNKVVVEFLRTLMWKSEEQLSSSYDSLDDIIDLEYFLNERNKSKLLLANMLSKLCWQNEYTKLLSNSSNAEKFSETNLPTAMITAFQQAEQEIIALAKVFRWL